MTRFTKAAIAALLAMPLAAPAVYAQDGSSSPNGAQSQTDGSGMSGEGSGMSGSDGSASEGSSGDGAASGGSMSGGDGMQGSDMSDAMPDGSSVVVSVGDTDITADEVREMLSAMPQQAQNQPVEVLVPIAVEELVMRELVLQDAQEQGMDDNDEVQQLRDSDASEDEIEGAIIRAYLAEELETEVSDDEAQETYDELSDTAQTELPPLEEVRPQIEQQIQQRRLVELRDELMADTEVVYYGPDGEPREPEDASAGAPGGSSSDDGSSSNDGSN